MEHWCDPLCFIVQGISLSWGFGRRDAQKPIIKSFEIQFLIRRTCKSRGEIIYSGVAHYRQT